MHLHCSPYWHHRYIGLSTTGTQTLTTHTQSPGNFAPRKITRNGMHQSDSSIDRPSPVYVQLPLCIPFSLIFLHLSFLKPPSFPWLWSPKHPTSLVQHHQSVSYWESLPTHSWCVLSSTGLVQWLMLLTGLLRTPPPSCFYAPSWLWGWDFHSLLIPVIVTKELSQSIILLPPTAIAPLGALYHKLVPYTSYESLTVPSIQLLHASRHIY